MESKGLIRKSVHQHPLMSRRGLMERSFSMWFDSFVYNQIWEDPRVDLEALQVDSRSRILTIASGGCNVLNYLSASPASVSAVDINQYHIYLTRLKVAALQYLPSYGDFFNFFGCANTHLNIDGYYKYVCNHLDEATRNFWEGGSWVRKNVLGPRINYFASNLYNYAKLGYLLRFVHTLCKLTRKNPARLLKATTKEEQERIFNETIAPFFDNRLVQVIGKQPLIMFSLGIPPSQLAAMSGEVAGDGIIGLYRERVRRLMCDFPIHDNYFVWQALAREYDHKNRSAFPEYLKECNYDLVKRNVSRVLVTVANLGEHLKSQPSGALNRFVLLDSQDWMKPEQIEDLWREIARVGRPGARIIFRTGSSQSPVEGALAPELKRKFRYEREISAKLHRKDRAAIYGGFHLYVVEGA